MGVSAMKKKLNKVRPGSIAGKMPLASGRKSAVMPSDHT